MSILDIAGRTTKDDILRDAGLDWTVQLSTGLHAPCLVTDGHTTSKRATVREDNGRVLGIVGKDYQIVQNEELVYMAQAITHNTNMKITNAGELRGGERVWLAVQADSIEIGNRGGDTIHPYLLLTNGHDGLNSLGGTPTSVRVICENTLNFAIKSGRKAGHFISIRHKGDMASKIDGLTATLGEFYTRTREFSDQANWMSVQSVDKSSLTEFFNKAYSIVAKPVEWNPLNKKEERAYNKKLGTFAKWYQTFDKEADMFGANLWTAFNAVTNWIDHNTSFRGDNKVENRFTSNLFGTNADKKEELFRYTLTGAGI